MSVWRQAVQTSERLQEGGRLSEAEQVLLDVLRHEPGFEPDGLAYIYNNLGSICQDQGRYLHADRHYRRSIAEWEKAGDPHRMALARTLNNLASLLWDTGKPAEAERVLIRSSIIQIDAVGPTHPEAAHLFYNLAAIRLRQKRWAEAAAAYRQVLALDSQLAGNSLETAVAANTLASIYRKTGRRAEANLLFERARLIWERSRDTRDVASDAAPLLLVDLATSFWSGNQRAEAESCVNRALAAVEARFGPSHPRTAQTLTLYAAVLRQTNRKAQARAMEKRARETGTGDAQLQQARATVDVSELIHRPKGR
jgi:tetratricopeptide (TPR) repeat protein